MTASDRAARAAAPDSTTKPVLLLTVGRTVGYIVSFVLPIALVRLFTREEFGTYKQLFLIYSTFIGIGQIGMAESLYYFLPRAPERAAGYVSNTILMLVLSGALLLGLTWGGATFVARWWNNPALVAYLPILGVFVALGLASIAFETVLVSQNRYGSAAILYGATDFARAVILLAAAALTRNLWWLLVGAVLYGALRCVAMGAYLVRRFGSALRPDRALWHEQLRYAVPFTIAVWASFSPEGFLVASWVSTATFAVYSVGCLNVPIVEVLASAFGNVLMVKMGEHIRQGRPVKALWHQINERLALVCVPLVGALLLTAPELFSVLFTPAYQASVPVFRVYAMSILLAIVPIDAALRSYAENRTLLVLYLTRLAMILALIRWTMGMFGLPGAVLAVIAAATVMRVLAVARIGRLMHLKPSEYLPWGALARIVTASALAALPAAFVRAQMLQWPPLLNGALTTLTYTLAYLPMVAAFGLVPVLALWPRWRLAANSQSE